MAGREKKNSNSALSEVVEDTLLDTTLTEDSLPNNEVQEETVKENVIVEDTKKEDVPVIDSISNKRVSANLLRRMRK